MTLRPNPRLTDEQVARFDTDPSQAIELSYEDLEGIMGGGSGVDMRGYAFGKAGMKDGEAGNRLGAELFHSLGWMSDDLYYSTTGQFDKIGTGSKTSQPGPATTDPGSNAGGAAPAGDASPE